ncbi:MAG TPA: TIGR03086 family metal-binding protein [Acidimicrobiia bacterium]
MDQIAMLEFAVGELRTRVAALDDAQMVRLSNCEPWTIRQLASHALNNQLLWGGVVTGEKVVSVADTMGGVPHPGDLVQFANDSVDRSLAMWRTAGVLEASHVTPFGELPGSIVINFPTIDALCHAWDLAASQGQPIEFPPEMIPAISVVFEATCTDAAREAGLIKAVAPTPADATDTERLIAMSGRSIRR